MRVDEFDYDLPNELIAQQPLADRAASRMLVLHRDQQRWEDRLFREFPSFLREGDCLIVNDTRVFPSRLYGSRPGGGRVEVFLLRALDTPLRWEALVRPGRKAPAGETLSFGSGLAATIVARGEHGMRTLEFTGISDLHGALDRIGHVPLPPYMKRPDTPEDRERYQTVFARERGSVAAPTAGLHFTPEVLEACRAAGAQIAPVTLHVGLGTFAPVTADQVEDVKLHAERYEVSEESLRRIRAARRRVAAGTTSARTVESVFETGRTSGETSLFIAPGYRFLAVDAMLTNFHLPKSSLLMLVCALAGKQFTLAAYAHAVRERYRFFSYGDCMLIL